MDARQNIVAFLEFLAEYWTELFRDNAGKLTRMSTFASHLTNAVFLQIGSAFLNAFNANVEGLHYWMTSLTIGCLTLFSVLFTLRICEEITDWLRARWDATNFALSEGDINPSKKRGTAGWVLFVVFLVLVNAITFGVGDAIRRLALAQVPQLEKVEKGEPITARPHVPSCHKDQCRA